MSVSTPATHRWFPVSTFPGNDPVTHCRWLGEEVFQFPFFNEGVIPTLQQSPDTRLLLLEQIDTTEASVGLPVTGFIYHTSHCGSTLLGRMLGAAPEVRVVSEPEALNGLLLSYALGNLPREAALAKLRVVIDAYRQPLPGKQYLIFKLSSWNIFMADLFQELFPTVPWFYLDREVGEVVHSLSSSSSGMVAWFHHPVANVRRFFVGDDFQLTTEAAFLEELVIRHGVHQEKFRNRHCCRLVYPTFLDQLETVILPHLKLSFPPEVLAAMHARVFYEAKSMEDIPYPG